MPFGNYSDDNLQNLESAHLELMTFFNAMEEVFFSVDIVNKKVIQISNGCEKLYGHKAQEFLTNNRLWFELMLPEDRHLVDDEDEILERGETVNKQYRIMRKDGAVRWVENKITPTLDEEGRLVRIDGMTWDITARKEAEKMRLQNDARYRQIVETAQEGIWMIDENDITTFVNKKMADILGYTPEEMIGKSPFLFMDDAGIAEAKVKIAKRRAGVKETIYGRFVSKTGAQVWALQSSNPLFDEAGNYEGTLSMMTDITQRRLAEEALKKSEANLRTIFDNTDSSYILIGPDLKIVSFNALAQKYSIEHNKKKLAIGEHIQKYFSAERWPFVKDILDNVAATGQTFSYELSFAEADGSVQWNDVRWLNVKNNESHNWGFILTNKNITETKVAALERERITADLAQHIKDLEQFTYIISHNLRAPVANIIGLSDMLKEEGLDPELKQVIVEKVSLSIRNIDSIIQDLNHILQTREQVNEKKETVYFSELCEAIKHSISKTIADENVVFKCEFTGIESLFTIRSYLYSIFYNLTSNSIKYRQPGTAPVISIKSRVLKNKAELRFKDNGKGIDLDKNASDLFGLYKRFDTSMEGKGMGLFMVKTQVEALGGTIKIKSKLGQGTEFIIQFDLQ